MQPMLSVVAVRGCIWHAAHALAREQVSYPAFGERIVLITMGSHRTPDTFFFQNPKRAHLFISGSKKSGTHFCVPIGGSGILCICICFIHMLYIDVWSSAMSYHSHQDELGRPSPTTKMWKSVAVMYRNIHSLGNQPLNIDSMI